VLPGVSGELVDDGDRLWLSHLFLLGDRARLIQIQHHHLLYLLNVLLPNFVLLHVMLVLCTLLQFLRKTIVNYHLLRSLLYKV
jgi:hypothetical protein